MKIILLGNGGHSKVIQEITSALDHEIIGILDSKYSDEFKHNGILYGPFASLNQLLNQEARVIIAIGDNKIRNRLADALEVRPEQYISLVHPTATVSTKARIGRGTVVMPNAVLNAGAWVGEHCIINTGAIVEHDNAVANFVHISPNATLTGNVSIAEGANVGASATIIPGKTIGMWSVIGAGSTVIANIPAYCKAVGSPARIIKKAASVQVLEKTGGDAFDKFKNIPLPATYDRE
ncbi:acetyltransferase [Halobacillus amylolyticus]|uniref:Acetyltransferase n=1 Tax=Halobacillus amylolyticus TaxID=2932259 RepID=A0ABY4HFV8_9BACI|nr:acetyltransferase [Halobacillus amylolyticus]UOR13796.1 acetyltransferase [Halobacillus amylolyticus]